MAVYRNYRTALVSELDMSDRPSEYVVKMRDRSFPLLRQILKLRPCISPVSRTAKTTKLCAVAPHP